MSNEPKIKVFNHRRTSAERSLDPMRQFDDASSQVVSSLFDTLLEYHYLKRPFELVPALLTEMPIQQKDKVTYLLKLRKGVFFHDDPAFPNGKGREMNADDVIYSYKRFADINVNQLSYTLFKGYVVGMDEFREATKKAGKNTDYDKLDIEGLKKIDDYTLSIKFSFENPLAFYPMASAQMSIVPREAVEKYGEDFQNNPVGTGPFYMKEYSRRGTHVLAKNPKYFQKFPDDGMPGDKEAGRLDDAGRPLPLVDEVHLPLIEEAQPAMLKFKKGELHWIRINKDDFNTMAKKTENGFELRGKWAEDVKLETEPAITTEYMKFNMEDPIVGKNKALRQAMALAIDVNGFIDLMHNGRGIPSESIVPLPIYGSAKDSGAQWYKQNLELAKEKLKEAGFPGGKGAPEITVEYRSTAKIVRQQFEYFRNQWAQIGLNVKANFQTFSSFLQRTEAGNFQVANAGWQADYPDAENFYQLLYSKNKAPGPNDGNFNNARFDELYEKIRFMENSPERLKLMKEMNEIVKEEVPVLLIYNRIEFEMFRKSVENSQYHLMENYPYKYFDLK